MKRVGCISFLIFVGTIPSLRALDLTWNPSPPEEAVLKYNVYEHVGSQYVLLGSVLPPRTSFTLPTLTLSLHTFAVTSVNVLGESLAGNEVTLSAFEFFNSAAITINTSSSGQAPASPYPSQIKIANVPNTIFNIKVTLTGLTHASATDIDVLLVGPKGQKVLLMSDTGGKNPVSNATLVFTDGASQSLTSNPISSGTYRPTNLDPTGNHDQFPAPAPGKPYVASLSAFNGTDPNGTWKLFVLDEGPFGSGTIAGGWSLTLNSPDAPMVAALAATNVTSSSATLNGTINPLGQASTSAFCFGLTANYTSMQLTQNAGGSTVSVPVSLVLTGLKPGTAYHYQLTGQNAYGGSSSNDVMFTTLPFLDSDHDGMPDDYEIANHFSIVSSADAALDSDGDGASNLQEYLAGTTPLDRASVLRIVAVQKFNGVWCSFPSVLGKRYQLQRTTDLVQPIWSVLQTDIPGNGMVTTVNDPSAGSMSKAFYRVVVLP